MSLLSNRLPRVVIRTDSYLKAVVPPFETLKNAKNAKQDCVSKMSGHSHYWNWGTYGGQDRHNRKTILGAICENSWCLSTESETVENTRTTEKETVSGGKGAGENAGIDDMGEN
jgi:hypothetical protein